MIAYLKALNLSNKITLFIIALCFALGCYASFIEPFGLKITHWPVSTQKWTHQKELKIAILTDIHMIWPWMTPGHLEKIVETANKLQPDIVVLLGDYVGTHPFGIQIEPQRGLEPLKELSPRCGVFVVIGNHDLHPPSLWPDALVKTEISVLQNRAQSVTCDGQKFWIAGLEDLWYQNANVENTLAQVSDQNPIIMLMHNPDSFPEVPGIVALNLAGHTHGGQVRFPFIGSVAAVIPSRYGERYVYGHIMEDDKNLVVSSGLGMTGLPVRLLTPPEITMVTLKAGQE